MAKKTSKARATSRKRNPLPGVLPELCPIKIHPELKEFLGYTLNKLSMRIRSRMEELMAPHGIGVVQCAILKMLHELGPVTQVELGGYMLVDKATMVRMLDGLEEAGFVVRTAHASDRRAKVLKLTAKGATVLKRAREARLEAEETVVAPLSKAERAELLRLVQKMVSENE